MSAELVNTSAPRGVVGGGGFCTVARTAGLPPAVEERLTLLSGYHWITQPGDAGPEHPALHHASPGENRTATCHESQHPVAWSHGRLSMGVGGKTVSVLSRVCDAGLDYSRRANRLAHHVLVAPHEQSDAGPAWVMRQPGLMRSSWEGEPIIFEQGPTIPRGDWRPRICQAWADATGDAGWAGALAGTFAADPARISWIIYQPGVDLLALLDEAIGLLPPALRWQTTFSTYFTDLAAGSTCAWRCCVAGTPAAAEARRQAGPGRLIDLTQTPPPLPDAPYVFAARNGRPVDASPVRIWSPQSEPTESTMAAATASAVSAASETSAASSMSGLEDRVAASERSPMIDEPARSPGKQEDDPPFDPAAASPGDKGRAATEKNMENPAARTIDAGPLMATRGSQSTMTHTYETQDLPATPPRRTRNRLLWAAAIAWPLIVAGAVLAYLLHTAPGAATRPIGSPTTSPTAP